MGPAALLALLAGASLWADTWRDLQDLREDSRMLERAAAQMAISRKQADTPARKVKSELEGVMKELLPLLEKLADPQGRYAQAEDLSEFEREREQIRGRIQTLHVRRGELFDSFNTHRQQEHLLRFRSMITEKKTGDLDSRIAAAMELEDFYQVCKHFSDRTSRILYEDDVAWAVARDRIAKHRRNRRWALGAALGFSVLAFGSWAALRRWKRAITTSLLAERGTSQPAISSPVSVGIAPGESGPGAGEAASLPGLPAAAAPVPGSVVGGTYRIERELGKGGMGVVLEALDLTLQRKVAIKRMRPEVSADPKELERFLAEARLVAALRHPNIVEIHTLVREGGELYLVFERVPGRTLAERLSAEGPLPPEAARDVLRQAAAALDYAHERKVIHRDLKPANIMVTPQGAVKVMDFGLAYQAKLTAARQTRADSWGTAPYMAPEQELGEISRSSDVFALGVCAYEILTGRLPFQGPNYLAQKRERRYAPPSSLARVGPVIDSHVARALSPEPAERFASAGELAASIATALTG